MLEDIIDATDKKFSDLKLLQEADVPLVMYGAGSYALDVTKFLEQHQVIIAEYCIDDEYVVPGNYFQGKPIRSIKEIYKKYEKLDIVIGFSDYIRAKKTISKLGDKARIFFIDAPNQFGFFDYSFILRNVTKFEETFNMLADVKSKKIFIAFINAKLSGDPSYLYPFAEFNQYFNDLVNLDVNEVFVDCGAYNGDTIVKFVDAAKGRYKKIFAFEPVIENQQDLLKTIKNNNIKKVELVKKGSWSSKGYLKFSSNGNMSSASEEGDVKVAVDTIDNIIGTEQASIIKMDIEGAELESLKGAKRVIIDNLPKLTICVYHKPEDLIEIPQYINSLSNRYDYYLRHHQHMSWEMVLYAIPKQDKIKR